jgi:hypothetical protein
MNHQELVLRALVWVLFAVFGGVLAVIVGLPFLGGLMLGAIGFPVVGPLVTGGIGKRSAAAPPVDNEIGTGTVVYLVLATAVSMSVILAVIWLLRRVFSS